jgi:hypothetical protein
MLTKTAEARVAKGAAYLDRVRPGWFNRIDVGTLTLQSPKSCVMAQSYDCEYCHACRSAGIQFLSRDGEDDVETQAQTLGFFGAADASFEDLQDAWIDAVAQRRYPTREPASTNALDPSAQPSGTPGPRA